jgi:primosomal protein N'
MIEDLARFVDRAVVGGGEDGLQVTVGSERDLIGLRGVGLGVVVDFDGMTGAPHYRATEDALRLIVRLAQATERGKARVMVQTSRKDQPLLDTLVSGHSRPFLEAEANLREQAGFPPFGSLIAIEIDVDHDADTLIRGAVGEHGVVRGPARMRDRQRWLIQGSDLDQARIGLRSAVGTLRSQGARVRVDADPIDL